MAVSGSGTQADPYIITTIEEFEDKASERGAYLKLANNIDLKNVVFNNGINVDCANIDGDGYAFLNPYINNCLFIFTRKVVFNNFSIINFIVDGVELQNAKLFKNSYTMGGIEFHDCSLTGMFEGYGTLASYGIEYYNSGLNLIFNDNSRMDDGGDYSRLYLNDSNVEIRGNTTGLLKSVLKNTYITGSIPNTYFTVSNLYGAHSSYYSIVDIETTKVESESDTLTTLVNSSKISGTISEYLKPVTPEQLANPEDLSELGFPIETNQVGG